jgi:hypothetical protein
LISFKIKNWDYIEPNKGNRNTLIYNIIPYLINTEGEFKNQKFEDKNNVTKMLRGYDRVLSLQGPNNTNEFHFVFYLVGSAVLSLASKAMDVKKILLEKDKQLLDELKFLIEKFETDRCSALRRVVPGGKRRTRRRRSSGKRRMSRRRRGRRSTRRKR